MQYITGLQVVMSSIAKAIGPLANIALLLLFAVIIFAIVGLEFYAGALNRTCYSLDDLGKKSTCTHYIVKAVPPILRNEGVINRSKRATSVLKYYSSFDRCSKRQIIALTFFSPITKQ